jgi:hypothetical protein
VRVDHDDPRPEQQHEHARVRDRHVGARAARDGVQVGEREREEQRRDVGHEQQPAQHVGAREAALAAGQRGARGGVERRAEVGRDV